MYKRLPLLILSISLQFLIWRGIIADTVAQDHAWQVYAEDFVVRDLARLEHEIWMATNRGVIQLDSNIGQQTLYTTDEGLASNDASRIIVDNLDHIWVITGQGVNRFDGQRWNTVLADRYSEHQMLSMTGDHAENIWFGLGIDWAKAGYGVARTISDQGDGSDEPIWISYTSKDGLAHNYVNVIAVDQNENVWFGTANGASRFDGQNWVTYTTDNGLTHNWVNAIAIDEATGLIWFGTEGGGLSAFDGVSWTTYTAVEGLASNVIRSLAIDQQGHLWAGSNNGVSKYDGSSWVTHYRLGDTLSRQVNALIIDERGFIWFGTEQGLIKLNDPALIPTSPVLPDIVANSAEAMPSPPSVSVTGPRLIDEASGLMYAQGTVDDIAKTLVLSMMDESLLKTYDLVGNLALDSTNGWLYIDQRQDGLAVINIRTEQLHTIIPLPGKPTYPDIAPQVDPAANQVLIFRDNVTYFASPENGRILDTLTSDITETEVCVSGPIADVPPVAYARHDHQAQLLYTSFDVFSCSSTAGINYGYETISYDMTTKTEIARNREPRFGGTALHGYFYQPRFYYIGAWRDGDRLVWRDGQPWFSSQGWADSGGNLAFDPTRQRFYEVTDTNLRIFEAETMALTMHLTKPITGTFERYNQDQDELQFRGADGRLRAWPADNIRQPEPEPLIASPLPTTPIKSLVISPAWPEDRTLLGIWHDPITLDNVMSGDHCDTYGNGRLYISLNGGQDWGRSINGVQGGCEMFTTVAISPDYARDQTLLAGVVGLGIFKSIDGGQLWLPSGTGLTQMTIQEILFSPNFADDQTAFARGRTQLYRSIDGGQVWTPIHDDRLEVMALSPEFAQDQIILGSRYKLPKKPTELHISRNGGNHWDLIGTLPEGITLTKLSLAPLFTQWETVFAAGQQVDNQPVLLVSVDGGQNWETVLSPTTLVTQIVYAPDIEQARPIFIVAGQDVYYSTDSGKSWTSIDLPINLPSFSLVISSRYAQDRLVYLVTVTGQVISLSQLR